MSAVQDIDSVNVWLALFSWSNLGNVLALLLILLAVLLFIRAVRSEDNDLNLLELFTERGRLGGSKMRLNGAWIITSWALVYLTLSHMLTEWFLSAYLAAFVADRMYARKTASKPDEAITDYTGADK